MPRKITVADLARWFWERSGKHGLSLAVLMRAGWPLDDHDQPLEVTDGVDVVVELPFALAEQALADGWSAADVLRAFADGLDPRPA